MYKRSTQWGIAAAFILVAGIAVAAVLLWPRTSVAQTQTTDSRKRVTVVGRGEVQITPDIARVFMGVQTEATDAQTALADNTTKMNALLTELKNAGIAEQDIQTSGFSIYPVYDYTNDRQTLRGYQVSNNVNVTIRDLANAGGVLDKVVAAGANNISGISFDVADPAQAQADARNAAILDARKRAEQYAGAGGASVGDVLVITEIVGQNPVPMREQAADMAGGSAVPIQPGQQTQTIDVQVTFELR